MSKPNAIQRGCRQGDPIAPYLFLMIAEVLNLLIERNTEIIGLQIGKNMFKHTQFADDTTIILDGSVSSLQATLKCNGNFWISVWIKNKLCQNKTHMAR